MLKNQSVSKGCYVINFLRKIIMYRRFLFVTFLLVLFGLSCAVSPKVTDSLTEQAKKDIAAKVEDMPAPADLSSIAKLPDPFTFLDGTRMTSKTDWERHRYEISQLVQKYVYGPKPPKPDSIIGSFNNNAITVKCAENDKTISFTARISYPSAGTAPYPAIIGIGGSTLPRNVLNELGIAVINFPNNDLGAQGGARDRGRGKFYDLYGSDHQASSLMAWAWGVSRLIDVLEQVPETNINPAKLGVTGCSRNGKGALVCGVFDDRIALTIPVESGSGGASSWRVADQMLESGVNVQTARQIVNENTWLAPIFREFGLQITKLPVDQHMVAAICAPRPLLIVENTSMTWLGDKPCYVTGVAAHKVWEALGVPENMGFVQTGGHGHCQFVDVDELTAFCKKFLLDEESDTSNIVKTDGDFKDVPLEWIDWDVPSLK